MRARRPTDPQKLQPAANDALIALVRLLAREAAREWLSQTPATPENHEQARSSDRK